MTCPISHPSDQDVLALINVQNVADLTKDDIDFDVPAVLTDDERNTSLVVNSKPEGRYNSFVEIKYDRLELARLFHNAEFVTVIVSGTPDKQDIVCGINAEYGTTFDAEEFDISATVNDRATLTAKATNHGYYGSIVVNLVQERVHLQDRLTEVNLNGFAYPNANTPSPNNIVYNDTVVTSINRKNGANNGDLIVSVSVRSGLAIAYPYSAGNGDPEAVGVRSVVSGGSRTNPSVQVMFKPNDTRTFLQLMQDYDIEVEFGSRTGSTIIKPVDLGNNTVGWRNATIIAGPNHTFANNPGTESYFTFDFGVRYTGTTTLQGFLQTVGMDGNGSGDSEGVTGLCVVDVRAQRKNTGRPWKLLTAHRSIYRY